MNEVESTLLACTDPSCGPENGARCDACRLRSLCLPAGLQPNEIAVLEGIIEYQRVIPAGTAVYHQDQPFTSLFAVLSGGVKTYQTLAEGKTSITGLHLPGELFGFSGINQAHYLTSAVALQKSNICEIPFDELENLCREVPGLQSQLLHLMSHRINDYQQHLRQLAADTTATSRIAAFLLGLAHRSRRRGESAVEFRLPATGHDISNYLGIRFETFSRNLNDLVRSGVIDKANRYITIVDREGLTRAVRASSGD